MDSSEHHPDRTYSAEDIFQHALKMGDLKAAEELDRYRKPERKAWRERVFERVQKLDCADCGLRLISETGFFHCPECGLRW